MIASSIGNLFLNEYNRRTNQNYSAKEFFEKEFYPLFYDHPKYMQWVQNSPFDQLSKQKKTHIPEERENTLEKLRDRIKSRDIDGSVAVGYFSNKPTATTSGQLTNLIFPLSENDLYASWIGSGLGVGVKGGFSIYFDEVEILWKIYKGWNKYRALLDEIKKLEPNKIDAWNGQWLVHINDLDFEEDAYFNPTINEKDSIKIPSLKWPEILLSIADNYESKINKTK